MTSHPALPILQVEGVSFNFPQRPLFDQLCLAVLPGVTLVKGGDGCGKSTLLRLMAGDLQAQAGELRILGVDLRDHAQAYQAQVFWTNPRCTRFDQITALAYFAGLRPRYPQWDDALLADLYAGLSLVPHGDKPLYMLSTGSKRKVWLAAACASGAALTLLDEPFAALDKASILFVRSLLKAQSLNPQRAWVLADYEAPEDVPLVAVIDLGD